MKTFPETLAYLKSIGVEPADGIERGRWEICYILGRTGQIVEQVEAMGHSFPKDPFTGTGDHRGNA